MIDKLKNSCRVCNNAIDLFMNFGDMPIANNLIPNNAISTLDSEFKYDMDVAFCTKCACFQVTNVPNKNFLTSYEK